MAATKMENNAQCPCRSPVNRSKSFDKNAQAAKPEDAAKLIRCAWSFIAKSESVPCQARDPNIKEGITMKPEIHPEYKETQVTCGCGEKFVTRSTVASGSIYVEVCSVCHPFYTGKQRILDTGGRVAKFEERFGKKAAK